MPKLTIDNQEVEVPSGATVLEAARRLGKDIPTMCFREGHPANTSCFVCVVKIDGSPRLLPACATLAEEGMVVENDTEEVRAVRRMALELLLSDHLGDCLGPCQVVCPAHVDVPRMIRHIAAGRIEGALSTFHAAAPFPGTLGYICAGMCQRACRRGQHDAPVAIRELHRRLGEEALERGLVAQLSPGQCEPVPCSTPGKRIAIVGAGPAGLTAAWFLQQAGCGCVVFDRNPQAGGGLRYGVHEDALPRSVLEAEIAAVAGLGASTRLETAIGSDDLADLRRHYDAVLLATGEITREGATAWGLPWARHGLAVEEAAVVGMAGVFAAGSAVSPSRHAARACGEGREVAEAILRFLAGEVCAPPRPVNTHVGRIEKAELERLLCEVSLEGAVEATGPEGRFTEAEAIREARRCLHCDCRKREQCRLRRYATEYGASPSRFHNGRRQLALDSSHPEAVYEAGKCISCGLCLQVAQQAGEPLGLAFVGRGFQMRTEVPFHEALAAGLQVGAAGCVEVCPTGALAWKDKEGPQ